MLMSANGYFGEFGGRYVPEILLPALLQLETAYEQYRQDPCFREELAHYLTTYVGRPT
ncbi:MAG: tryptophan synthase subunit beta, partial [Clostridia bacterium]|nr:tryptophan synthase subunit beta [Clostridia bacterium]